MAVFKIKMKKGDKSQNLAVVYLLHQQGFSYEEEDGDGATVFKVSGINIENTFNPDRFKILNAVESVAMDPPKSNGGGAVTGGEKRSVKGNYINGVCTYCEGTKKCPYCTDGKHRQDKNSPCPGCKGTQKCVCADDPPLEPVRREETCLCGSGLPRSQCHGYVAPKLPSNSPVLK